MKNSKVATIVLTGGGTAGHCMPNFYMLDELAKIFDKIVYIGSHIGLEKDLAKKFGIDYYEIDTCKLVRGKFWKNLKIPFVLIKSIRQCKRLLKQIQPNIIFSKGGFVALPVCIAGKKLKIPVISHESDFSFGLANKIILKCCTKMCVNYPHLADNKKIIYTGPILPQDFGTKQMPTMTFNIDKSKKTIVFVGGSQGSTFLNKSIFSVAHALESKYNIIHICGKNNSEQHDSFGNYNLIEYCSNMSQLL